MLVYKYQMSTENARKCKVMQVYAKQCNASLTDERMIIFISVITIIYIICNYQEIKRQCLINIYYISLNKLIKVLITDRNIIL